MSSVTYSVVGFAAQNGGYRCGYCGGGEGAHSYGMEAFKLTPSAYQTLLDRGWRRSGTYCYKPTMEKTCCPAYTIRCDATNFRPSKSQKKVVKRMRRFLMTGDVPERRAAPEDMQGVEEAACREFPQQNRRSVDIDEVTDISDDTKVSDVVSPAVASLPTPSNNIDYPASVKSSSSKPADQQNKKKCGPSMGADPSKPPCRKAKDVRRERRLAKIAAAAGAGQTGAEAADVDMVGANSFSSGSGGSNATKVGGAEREARANKHTDAAPKSLEDLIDEPLPEGARHFLELRMVRAGENSADGSVDHRLFQTYQQTVHGETQAECAFLLYNNFLCDTPLSPERGLPDTFGSYHHQYWLDGTTLIAVAVLDILPASVSSVYLYYDPSYSFLSLGTYSALRELALVRKLHATHSQLQWYYMGYYIHSCPKMRYKGGYAPSSLLCPETYSWQPLPLCRPALTARPYARLCPDPTVRDPDLACPDRLDDMLMLHKRTVYRLDSLEDRLSDGDFDREVLRQYVSMVGRSAFRSLVMYRP